MRADRHIAASPTRHLDPAARFGRHAFVMTVWLPTGISGLLLLAIGYRLLLPGYVAAGFAALLAGFAGHVLINVLQGTHFSTREVALWLVSYGMGVAYFLMMLLAGSVAPRALFLPTVLGLVSIPIAVGLYLIIRYGVRRAFESFDVISNFRV